jgi:putative tricarboxylic transport membrane protein
VIGRRNQTLAAGELYWRGLFLSAGLVLAYIVLFEVLGYILATTGLIFFTARILESRRWLRDLLVSAVIAVAAYIVFQALLNEGLPRGWLLPI